MNSFWIANVTNDLRRIATTPNIINMQFTAVQVANIRESILKIIEKAKQDDPQVSRQLDIAKNDLFLVNQFGQTFINPVALGQVIFGLDFLVAKQKTQMNMSAPADEMWSYIHPMIHKSSKKLFEDGHYANAAEDAFIEINARVKNLFSIVNPGNKVPDGDAAMTTVFSTNNPLVEFCDRGTETGFNKQKGYMQMLAGAMSALRNPKAHSNNEILSAEEAYRRLATASMLMYAIDDAVKYSKIKE